MTCNANLTATVLYDKLDANAVKCLHKKICMVAEPKDPDSHVSLVRAQGGRTQTSRLLNLAAKGWVRCHSSLVFPAAIIAGDWP